MRKWKEIRDREVRSCESRRSSCSQPKSKGEGWGRVGVSAVRGAREGWSVGRGCEWVALRIVRVGRSSPLFFGSAPRGAMATPYVDVHTEETDRQCTHRPGARPTPLP